MRGGNGEEKAIQSYRCHHPPRADDIYNFVPSLFD